MQRSVEERLLLLRFLARAGRGYAWSSLKNCVKVLIGRKTYFNDHDLFFRQYVFHVTGLRTIRRVTCPGLIGEGAGSQALMIMNAINFAHSSGLAYVHTPFASIAHSDRPIEEWIAAWEALFNLGAGEVRCSVKRHEVVNYCYNFDDLELCFGWHGRKDELTTRFKERIPEFRRKYRLNKSPRKSEHLAVAVHIRRGDVSAANALFTKTDAVLRTITAVKSVLDSHDVKYTISIYSEGKREEFQELPVSEIEFFLDADPVWTMGELIEADVLIMAKGSFSYYAGLISEGIRIFEPYSDPLESWILRSPDGSFDRTAFERQLVLLLQAKSKVS